MTGLLARPAAAPLTAAPAGVWYAQQLDPAGPVYRCGELVELAGPLDVTAFERTLRQAVGEAEVLNRRIEEQAGEPWAVPVEDPDWPLAVVDLSAVADPGEAALTYARGELARPVDLAAARPHGHALLRLGPDRWAWLFLAHHVALDAYGFGLVEQRVADLYSALTSGREAEASPFRPLAEVAAEESAYLGSDKAAADAAWWRDRYADDLEPVSPAGR